MWQIKKSSYLETAKELQEQIPELKGISTFYLEDKLKGSGLSFVKKEKKRANFWIRLTLPFAMITMVALILFCPFKFLLTGSWNYKSIRLSNWLSALGLHSI